MSYEEIEYEVTDRVATIALNRPDKMNTGTTRMIVELLDALDQADKDDNVRAVIFTGRGRAFCAGADLSGGDKTFDYAAGDSKIEAPADAQTIEGGKKIYRDGAGLITLRIFELNKPVIAAINGAAVGMGATMTLPCDIRIAAESARFGFVFAKRGIVPEGASTWFLPRVVGVQQAAEWLYSGRVFNAPEALAGGLVKAVVPNEELLATAMTLAREFAESAPLSVALTRQMLWRGLVADHPMYMHRVDSRAVQVTGASPDAREGVASFLEKRAAEFSGSVSKDLPDVFPDWENPSFS